MLLSENISNFTIFDNYVSILDDGKLNNYNSIYLLLNLVNYNISSYKDYNIIYTLHNHIIDSKIILLKQNNEIRIRYILTTNKKINELSYIRIKNDIKYNYSYCLYDVPITIYNIYEICLLFK